MKSHMMRCEKKNELFPHLDLMTPPAGISKTKDEPSPYAPDLTANSPVSSMPNAESSSFLNNAVANACNSISQNLDNIENMKNLGEVLRSVLAVFDEDVRELDTELASLKGKLCSLSQKRTNLLHRRETIEFAFNNITNNLYINNSSSDEGTNLMVHQPEDFSNTTSSSYNDENSGQTPAKRSKRKPCSIRHVRPSSEQTNVLYDSAIDSEAIDLSNRSIEM